MAELGEVKYWPPSTINGRQHYGFHTFPAAPLEYFSPSMAKTICECWPRVRGEWLHACICTITDLQADNALYGDQTRWLTGALDDLCTLHSIVLDFQFPTSHNRKTA